MELFHAHHQWATRPQDQRFATLDQLYMVTRAYAEQAKEKSVPWSDLRVEASGDDLQLVGKAGVPAAVTHYAFGQLAGRAGAPAEYLRNLPPTLAAQNLNYGLKEKSDATGAQLLFHANGGLVLRAATSDTYSRVWNYEVVARLQQAAATFDLVPARSTFRSFDPDEMPALYASDHDLFAFVMSRERSITDPMGQALYRGVIVVNSEVGAASLKILGFMFREICGNHIIWGAKELTEVRLRHIGNVRERWNTATVEIRKYLDHAGSFDETQLQRSATLQLGGTKEEVLDALFAKRATLNLSRKTLDAGYTAVQPDVDGDPRTAYGMVQGLTRHSQTIPYADERQVIDRAASKLLDF